MLAVVLAQARLQDRRDRAPEREGHSLPELRRVHPTARGVQAVTDRMEQIIKSMLEHYSKQEVERTRAVKFILNHMEDVINMLMTKSMSNVESQLYNLRDI